MVLATALVLVTSPALDGGAPRWVYGAAAALIFCYQTLDGSDGKQARATGIASASKASMRRASARVESIAAMIRHVLGARRKHRSDDIARPRRTTDLVRARGPAEGRDEG